LYGGIFPIGAVIGIMNKNKIVCGLLLGVWLAISLVSLMAMYHLWWTRERTNYVGKSAEEQRAVVFERAGLPVQTLEMARQADAVWPLDVAYKAAGSEVSLSYFKYLLLPRIPSGSEKYRINERGGTFVLVPADGPVAAHLPFLTVDSTPRGLILSAMVLFAIAAGLSHFGLNLPEGVAGASLLLCASSLLLTPLFHSYMPIGVFICGLGVVGVWSVWRQSSSSDLMPAIGQMPVGRWAKGLQYMALGIVGGAVLWSLLMSVVVVPDDWDSWAIWGPKAKVLLLGTGPLSEVTYFGHPDYPLLWPSVWAFSSWCSGGWEDQWSKAWGVIFLVLVAWQVGDLSRFLSKRREAMWLAPAILLSMPAIPLIASWGYSEAPLWLMLICSFRRLMKWSGSGRLLDAVFAGLFASAAALTKNEGLLFAVLGLLWMASAVNKGKWRSTCAYAASFLVFYVPWVSWIRWGAELSPGKSLEMNPETFHLFMGRFIDSVALIGRMWVDVRQWNVVLVSALALTVIFSIRSWRTISRVVAIPIAMGMGTLAVIIMREGVLGWQIGTAWNRLTIQFFVLLLPALAAGFSRTHSSECACPKRRLEQK